MVDGLGGGVVAATSHQPEGPATALVFKAAHRVIGAVIIQVILPAPDETPLAGYRPECSQVGLAQSEFALVSIGKAHNFVVGRAVAQPRCEQIFPACLGVPAPGRGKLQIVNRLERYFSDDV